MVSLNRFEVFRAVVETGSFTGAATQLNQARAAVSFNIKQLEAELGVSLLTRTTRRTELTDAGERFYERCLRVLSEAEAAVDEARGEHGGMEGNLRITSTVEYGVAVIAPAMHEFMALHSGIRVRLETHTAPVDLVRDRFDVAIRLGRFEQFQDSPYRGVRLDTYEVRAVVSPILLARFGLTRIETPIDLSALPQLTHSRLEKIQSWALKTHEDKEHTLRLPGRPRIVADNASILRAMALQGSGVAILPEWQIREDLAQGTLIDALPDFRFPLQNVYALYLSTRHIPTKIRTWIDFMKQHVVQSRLAA